VNEQKSIRQIRTVLLHVPVILVAIVTLVPFLAMLSKSFEGGGGVLTEALRLIPKEPTIKWYVDLFKEVNFLVHFKNSIIVSFSITFLNLLFCSMAAYAFAKMRFLGRDKLFTLFLATMMVPGQITMIPVFLFLQKLGLLNSYWGLILPMSVTAFGIFLIRQYMMTIPNELIEAARIDGCSDFRIFRSVILPLCRPVLATLGVFTFMGAWNDFLWPLIIMVDESLYTLPVALANLNDQNMTKFSLLMAGSVVVIIPVVLVFLFAQKYVIRGIATTGIKE